MKKGQWTEICWEGLNGALEDEKLFSTYNLLGKKKYPKTQFFKHPASPGEYPGEAVSVCIDKFGGEWEIFLYPNGTWELK